MSACPENVLRTRCGVGLFGTVSFRPRRFRLRRWPNVALERWAFGGWEERSSPCGSVESTRFVGAPRRSVVGDQHRHPRQRDRRGNDQQRDETVVPQAIRDGGQNKGRNPERHQCQVFADPLTVLYFVCGCGGGDEDRSTIVVETQLMAAPHLSTVAQLRSR